MDRPYANPGCLSRTFRIKGGFGRESQRGKFTPHLPLALGPKRVLGDAGHGQHQQSKSKSRSKSNPLSPTPPGQVESRPPRARPPGTIAACPDFQEPPRANGKSDPGIRTPDMEQPASEAPRASQRVVWSYSPDWSSPKYSPLASTSTSPIRPGAALTSNTTVPLARRSRRSAGLIASHWSPRVRERP